MKNPMNADTERIIRQLRIRSRGNLFVVAVAALAFCACGSDGPEESENYGNLLNSPAGLILVQEEHATGWLRTECFACHEPRNSHQVNRTGLPDCEDAAPDEACIDLPEIRETIGEFGEDSCVLCHGNNGVEP